MSDDITATAGQIEECARLLRDGKADIKSLRSAILSLDRSKDELDRYMIVLEHLLFDLRK